MGSSTLPLFEQSCHEVLARLEGDYSAAADSFRARAREHLRVLEGWQHNPPVPEARSATISDVLGLYSDVLKYITATSNF